MTRSKVINPLHNVDLGQYEKCVEWVRRYARTAGFDVYGCVFDPDAATWFFYDFEGRLVLRLGHVTMELLWDKLRKPLIAAVAFPPGSAHDADDGA